MQLCLLIKNNKDKLIKIKNNIVLKYSFDCVTLTMFHYFLENFEDIVM